MIAGARSAVAGVGQASQWLAAGVLVLLLAACAARAPAPVEDRWTRSGALPPGMAGKPGIAPNPAADSSEPDPVPPTYTVKRGDTLHVIALEFQELSPFAGLLESVWLLQRSKAQDPP